MTSRDEKLAAKLKDKKGDRYESASDRSARRAARPEPAQQSPSAPGSEDNSDAKVYDRLRSTPASQQRRRASKSADGVTRWRRSVPDEWNR